MKKNPSIGERILSLRADMSQAKFGELLGMEQATVSAWEVGKTAPSPEAYMKLGNLAPYPDNLWYWEQAGMSKQAMLSVAEKILKERNMPATKGEILQLPSIRRSTQGKEEEVGTHPERASGILNPLSTKHYILETPQQIRGLETNKIEAILDVSNVGPQLFLPYWNKAVLISLENLPEQRSDFTIHWGWQPGLYMGKVRLDEQGNGLFYANLRPFTGAVLAERSNVRIWTPLGFWDAQNAPDAPELRPPGASYFDPKKTRKRAGDELRPHPGCTILGRVIKWWRP
jgi:transcriptional regulator with XRE-family HTH domain